MNVRSELAKLMKDTEAAGAGECPGQYENYPEGGHWYIREGRDPYPEIPECLLCHQRHMKPEHREPPVIVEVIVRTRAEALKYTEVTHEYPQ
jgi:hypothetical protein